MAQDIAFTARLACYTNDSIDSTEIKDGVLNLSSRNLINLPTISRPDRIIHLVLDSNFLTETLQLPYMENLETISMNNNKIFDLDEFLRQLRDNCPNLSYVSLLGCPACPYPYNDLSSEACKNYRQAITSVLPQIKLIDHIYVTQSDFASQRPKQPSAGSQRSGKCTAVYQRVRRVYTGKLSEGNRFITDDEL